MNNRRPVINNFGQVAESGIHDASLVGFSFVKAEKFEIILSDLSGSLKTISFIDVSEFGFKDIISGTIISDIFIFRLNDKEVISKNSIFDYWKILLGETVSDKALQNFIKTNIHNLPSHYLVAVDSSYGGQICLICSDIMIF